MSNLKLVPAIVRILSAEKINYDNYTHDKAVIFLSECVGANGLIACLNQHENVILMTMELMQAN